MAHASRYESIDKAALRRALAELGTVRVEHKQPDEVAPSMSPEAWERLARIVAAPHRVLTDKEVEAEIDRQCKLNPYM